MKNQTTHVLQLRAACFGKSTIAKSHPDYSLIYRIARILVHNGIGTVHGGYSGGAMEAIDEGSVHTAKTLGLDHPEQWSIGVPVQDFEEGWGKTTAGTRLPPVHSLEERLETMDQYAHFYIVLPRGGTGTAHELIHYLMKSTIYTKAQKPMIIFGDHWKALVNTFYQLSDTSDTLSSFPWIHTVSSMEEFTTLLPHLLSTLQSSSITI